MRSYQPISYREPASLKIRLNLIEKHPLDYPPNELYRVHQPTACTGQSLDTKLKQNPIINSPVWMISNSNSFRSKAHQFVAYNCLSFVNGDCDEFHASSH